MKDTSTESLERELAILKAEEDRLTEEFDTVAYTGDRRRNGEITIRQSEIRAKSKKIIAELAKRQK